MVRTEDFADLPVSHIVYTLLNLITTIALGRMLSYFPLQLEN